MLALLIGLVTVVIGCWLSDNCWSPEPEGMTVTVAWPPAKRGPPASPLPPPTPISAVSTPSSSPTTEPSSPDSDWPLVDTSEAGDSPNLWHHALCEKNSLRRDDRETDKEAVLGNGHACPLRDHGDYDYEDNTEHADTDEVTGEDERWRAKLE